MLNSTSSLGHFMIFSLLIIVIIHTTLAFVKLKPEKNSRSHSEYSANRRYDNTFKLRSRIPNKKENKLPQNSRIQEADPLVSLRFGT